MLLCSTECGATWHEIVLILLGVSKASFQLKAVSLVLEESDGELLDKCSGNPQAFSHLKMTLPPLLPWYPYDTMMPEHPPQDPSNPSKY